MSGNKQGKTIETKYFPAGCGWTITPKGRDRFYALRITPETIELLWRWLQHNPGKQAHLNMLANKRRFTTDATAGELPHWNLFFHYEEVK